MIGMPGYETTNQTLLLLGQLVGIHREFGGLDDLPKPLVPVIWVTVYRSMQVGLEAERTGGVRGLVKDTLQLGDAIKRELQEATLSLEFLQKMIPNIRASQSQRAKLADAQLLIDMLKWGMMDAFDRPLWRRFLARLSAKADPLYRQPVPSVILAG